MKLKKFVLIVATLLVMPVAGFTSGEHGMDHSKMDTENLGMSTDGKMIMLGMHEVDGVKGFAHLNDVRIQMAEHGMNETHHIMVAFEDVATGDAIESGVVAVKVEDPDGNISEPIKLSGMDGHFGVDLTLDKKGMYHFKVGTKLADGKKRTFHHHFENN